MSASRQSRSPFHLAPQATPRVDRSEQTRTALLNAALDFLWDRPFRDMTVGGLMAPTGVGRSAFYQYFHDLHELMETLLGMLQDEIFEVADPWIAGVGDPVALLDETLTGLVRICYERGPLVRAVSDAAPTDKRLEEIWNQFLGRFDDAANRPLCIEPNLRKALRDESTVRE